MQTLIDRCGGTMDTAVLRSAAAHAIRLYEELDRAPVAARVGYDELRRRVAPPLSDSGLDPVRTIDELVRDTTDALVGAGGPRFFGWVIGGSIPAAIAADWIVSAWEQNGAIYQTSPASAVLEEVASHRHRCPSPRIADSRDALPGSRHRRPCAKTGSMPTGASTWRV